MGNIVRELVLQSTPLLPAGFMHCQTLPFSRSQALKTTERHILGDFLNKFVTGTALSSYYGCSLAIANPISPEHSLCIKHRDVRHYNNAHDYQR